MRALREGACPGFVRDPKGVRRLNASTNSVVGQLSRSLRCDGGSIAASAELAPVFVIIQRIIIRGGSGHRILVGQVVEHCGIELSRPRRGPA